MLQRVVIQSPDNHLYSFYIHVWSENELDENNLNDFNKNNLDENLNSQQKYCTVKELKFLLELESKLPQDLMRFLFKEWELSDSVLITEQMKHLTCVITPRTCHTHIENSGHCSCSCAIRNNDHHNNSLKINN